MPSLFSDDLADGLRRMYLELRDRTEKLERQLPSLQRNHSREDFILLQASTTGSIPAVTASTTGITPGKTTVAKMLTINSSDKAVRTTSDRTVTAYNFGTGAISAGKPFPAHREYLTGKFATWGAAVSEPPPVSSFALSRGTTPVNTPLRVSLLQSPDASWSASTASAPTAMISNTTRAHMLYASINVQWDVSVTSTNKFANGYIQADKPVYGTTYLVARLNDIMSSYYYFYAIGTTGTISRTISVMVCGLLRLPSGGAFELQPSDFGGGTQYGTMTYSGRAFLAAVSSSST